MISYIKRKSIAYFIVVQMFVLVIQISGCGGGGGGGNNNEVIADPPLAPACTATQTDGESVYQYDKNGRLIRVCNATQVITYGYDKSGNITSIESG